MLCNAPEMAALVLSWRYVGALPFYPHKHKWMNVSTLYGSHTLTMYSLWTCLGSPENKWTRIFPAEGLSLEFFFSGRSGMMIFRWLVFFKFPVTLTHLTLVICDNAAHKIITIAFEARKHATNRWHISSPALFTSDINWCGIQ